MKNVTIGGAGLLRDASVSNMRLDLSGKSLVAVGLPMRVADKAMTPLCAISSGHVIASLGSDIYALPPAGGNPVLVAALGEGGESYCAVSGGDRAIVMTSRGAQHIVVRGGEAVSLGTMPDLPAVSVTLEEAATLTETVEAMALTDLDALRSGALGAADAKALTAALDDAWKRLAARAKALGCAIIPSGASVTAEVRKLDSAGEPVGSRGRIVVGGGSDVGEVYAAVTDGVIAPFQVSVRAMKLRVEADAADPEQTAAWGEGAIMAQVAVSAAPRVTASWRVRVERPASGETRLTAVCLTEAEMPEPDAPLQSVAVFGVASPSSFPVSLPVSVTDPLGEMAVPDGFIAKSGAVSGDVVVWAGIEGRRGDIAMASVSSPLSVRSIATVSFSPVVAVAAAPRLGSAALSPGCAHFYAFTSGGTLNVSVGTRRGAPAASLLDSRPVSKREAVAVMPEGVAALTDRGDELILLRGGRASTLIRLDGLTAVEASYEPVSSELYLLASDGNLWALDIARKSLSRRLLPYQAVSMATCGHRLLLVTADGIADASAEDHAGAAAIEWTAPLTIGQGGAVAGLTVSLDATDGFTGEIALYARGFCHVGGDEAEPVWRAMIDGAPRAPLAFRLPIPLRAAAAVRIKGFAAPGSRLDYISYTYSPLSNHHNRYE